MRGMFIELPWNQKTTLILKISPTRSAAVNVNLEDFFYRSLILTATSVERDGAILGLVGVISA